MEVPHHCAICQLSWTGPPDSVELHEAGKTHQKRLRNPRAVPDPTISIRDGRVPPWSRLPMPCSGARDPPASQVIQFWPWKSSTTFPFQRLSERFLLCMRPSSVEERLSCAQKVREVQSQMRRCVQQPEDFEDLDALWGYTREKFVLRSSMAFNALTKFAPDTLQQRMAGPFAVAAMGGGPAAELFAAVVARDLAGGRPGKMAVYEWVDTWSPIVETVSRLLGEEIQYHHCDVSKPLLDAENLTLSAECSEYDLYIFSHVLLECGRGGGEAPLQLLEDLWDNNCFILVLDAGQARGRGCRERPLAGSLRLVESWAGEVGAPVIRINGWRPGESQGIVN
eukprot:symbB.v1.2.027346.t1/scaffold2800.1/size70044/2